MNVYLAQAHGYRGIHEALFSHAAHIPGRICREREMNIYLAGTVSRPYAVQEGMKAMDVYLAGCFPCGEQQKGTVARDIVEGRTENTMKIYLSMADGESSACYKDHPTISGEFLKKSKTEDTMNIYLAESGGCHKAYTEPAGALRQRVYILESFYYVKEWMIPYIQNYWHFLLDSGAFTFMTGKNDGTGVNWDDYVDRYAEFINANKIDLFFEVDIDNVVGLKEVERLRARLEAKTGKQCIPVWHKKRGKQQFLDICRDYPYVALGGIVAKEFDRKEYQVFPWFIDTAHSYRAKIHGLGFTNLKLLSQYHFDSVDSTAWVYGNMSGKIYSFTGKTLVTQDKQSGQRLKSARDAAIHNFKEWVKFQRYAEVHL
jgi:hypothetical protein